ncbi:16S rRNA (uracil(1498)-N(3))-methyltransferase [Nesterenkonia marinintestina]|uniref:16S rRNA (uracil(1498)-N(3))-methyltransferase n=1 Tax=Nesterenkonia marinintestina TaxID=2979865 RepID=UPI0021BFB07F|nr:16S rRNA (uracil(1498)-N(3))-methyltransferase [Nesterenkonia sp. GX14115]
MTAPLFHLPPGSLDLAAVGVRLTLDGDEGHHAATVMRLSPGERIDLSDTGRIRVSGVVSGLVDGGLEVEVRSVEEHRRPHPELVLVQALAKDRRDLQAVETAVELGADRIIPWSAARSVARWPSGREAKKHAEWENTVRTAAKQSRRTGLPPVEALHSTRALIQDRLDVDGTAAAVLHEQADRGPGQVLESLGVAEGDGPRRLMLIVGPEGGVSEEELDRLRRAGAVPMLLGPHVLRTSTAGPAALAAVQILLGRWDVGTVPGR